MMSIIFFLRCNLALTMVYYLFIFSFYCTVLYYIICLLKNKITVLYCTLLYCTVLYYNTETTLKKQQLCTVICVLYSMYCTLCTVLCVLYSVYCTLYTVLCVLYSVYCTLCNVLYVLYSMYCTLCTVLCVLYCPLCTVLCVLYVLYSVYSMYCTLCTVLCVLYSVYSVYCTLCTLCTVLCVLYSVYCTLWYRAVHFLYTLSLFLFFLIFPSSLFPPLTLHPPPYRSLTPSPPPPLPLSSSSPSSLFPLSSSPLLSWASYSDYVVILFAAAAKGTTIAEYGLGMGRWNNVKGGGIFVELYFLSLVCVMKFDL